MTGDTPLALLLSCHEKIRHYVGGLATIAALPDRDDPRIPAACDQIARYLREGLPLHVRDEEDSLAPRLPSAAVDVMIAEHRDHEPLLADTIAALTARDVAAFAGLHARMQPAFEAHLQAEEQLIFPFLDQLRDPAVFVAELRARRTG